MQVTLVDGSVRDLEPLDETELDQLHWEQERAFAQRILQAPKGSEQRAQAFAEGYDTITKLISHRESAGDSLVMGLSPRYIRLVLKLLRQRGAAGVQRPRLFEIGFGSGAVLDAVARAGFDVAGIEVSDHMRRQARRRMPEASHDHLYLGDFLTHPLSGDSQSYDMVYWNDVFEHLPPDESCDYLRRIHELLAPGGVLLTITPNWHTRPADITGAFKPPRSPAEGFHLKEYTLREMAQLLRARASSASARRCASHTNTPSC